MKVRFWGTRGSVPTPRPEMVRYGGNTSCVEVLGDDPGHLVVLDAGTGIVGVGNSRPHLTRVDILLSHLHMDHILGLGFFGPLFRPDLDVHLWGPSSTVLDLRARLSRYLSPPLFPVHIRELPSRLTLHDTPLGTLDIPGFTVQAALVCHPGPTVGYRLTDGRSTLTYLSDHEPALAADRFPDRPEWTSGFALAHGADVLIHDAQYSDDEYPEHFGWGHSSISHAVRMAALADVGKLVAFHHDPGHDDDTLDRLYERFDDESRLDFDVVPARECETVAVGQVTAMRDTVRNVQT